MKSEIPFSGIGGKKRGKSTASSPLLRQGKKQSFLTLPREESPTTYDSTRFNYSSFSGMEVQLLNFVRYVPQRIRAANLAYPMGW